MAEIIKYIFKNNIIGEPVIQKVLRNRIQGVSGELVDITQIPREDPTKTNTITTEQRLNYYNYDYTFERFQDISTDNQILQVGEASIDYVFDFNFDVTYSYSAPVENITVSADVVCNRITFTQDYQTQGIFPLPETDHIFKVVMPIVRFVEQNQSNQSLTMQLGTTPKPNLPSDVDVEGIRIECDVVKTTTDADRFKVGINISLKNKVEHGKLLGSRTVGYFAAVNQWMSRAFVNLDILDPLYIEIKVNADTYRITPQAWQIGEIQNAIKLSQNPLVTTKSKKGAETLYQFIGNKIINEWHRGKQTTHLTKVINCNGDIEQKNYNVKVINARKTDFVDDSQSYSKNSDGSAKVFVVDSSEIIYDGNLTQRLDISEKTT